MIYALQINYATCTPKWIHEQEVRLASSTYLEKNTYIDHLGFNEWHLPSQKPPSPNLVNLSGVRINNKSSKFEHIG